MDQPHRSCTPQPSPRLADQAIRTDWLKPTESMTTCQLDYEPSLDIKQAKSILLGGKYQDTIRIRWQAAKWPFVA